MDKKLFRLLVALLVITVLVSSFVMSAQDSLEEFGPCGDTPNATIVNVPQDVDYPLLSGTSANAAAVVPPDGQTPYLLMNGREWFAEPSIDGWVRLCLPTDNNADGFAPVTLVLMRPVEVQQDPTATPIPSASENDQTATFEANLDGDEQLCVGAEECSFDVGVNEYDEGDETAQIGMAWGDLVSWDGNLSEGDYAFVLLQPGWYLDLTMTQGGGYRVYNYPTTWTAEQFRDHVLSIAAEVLAGSSMPVPTSLDQIANWDSSVESISNSASGTEGVGPGDNYPQLDGQDFSCFPQMGPCPLNVTVNPERQIGIVFGAQIDYQQLEGPHSDDPEESLRDVAYRCDMVILTPGAFNGLILRDARVEIYNVPSFDQSGWFRNLVAERAEEQAIHYGCPHHEVIPIWNADGTTTSHYILRWMGDDATAGGPDDNVVAG